MSCAKQFFTVQVKWQLLAYLIFSLSAAFSPFRYTSITNKGEEETETVEKSRFAELSEDDLHAMSTVPRHKPPRIQQNGQ